MVVWVNSKKHIFEHNNIWATNFSYLIYYKLYMCFENSPIHKNKINLINFIHLNVLNQILSNSVNYIKHISEFICY